jgi:hypothetical protein
MTVVISAGSLNMIQHSPEFKSGQLFWWQESPQMHTLITLWAYPLAVHTQAKQFLLTFALFSVRGELQTTWQQSLQVEECLFLDSATCPATQALSLTEGVLAVSITTVQDHALQTESPIQVEPPQLYSIIDWYSETGDLVSLHSDQILRPRQSPVEWTEMVVQETATAQNFLVILNGAEPQPTQSITLKVQNTAGEIRQAIYEPEIAAFSCHRLYLAQLFPNLLEFCQELPISLTGSFTSRAVFVRPYVMTQGQYLSGYHGGDRYFWENQPAIVYKWMGQGEVNPMVAIHQSDLKTTVNLLNTHATLEQDFWVDACLYDQQGQRVAEQERWLLARRHQLTRGEIADLLPASIDSFTGHIALRFSPDEHPEYPSRLQALMEYRTSQGTSRVMAWSDTWNWQDRARLKASIVYQSYYRVWWKFPLVTEISVTNCGIDADYQQSIHYIMRLENGRGESLLYEGTLAAQATDYYPIDFFFPQVEQFLGEQKVGLVVIESQADLAIVQLTKHYVSGVYAVEHFLPAPTVVHEKKYYPCGS